MTKKLAPDIIFTTYDYELTNIDCSINFETKVKTDNIINVDIHKKIKSKDVSTKLF
jgi:hypothetical protein